MIGLILWIYFSPQLIESTLSRPVLPDVEKNCAFRRGAGISWGNESSGEISNPLMYHNLYVYIHLESIQSLFDRVRKLFF
jgi:hypothetical protein